MPIPIPLPSPRPGGSQVTHRPYYVRERQDWAVDQEHMRHNQALYQVGEYALFALMWHLQDFLAGLVGRCTRCYASDNPVQNRISKVYEQPTQNRCPVCFGTTFEGGYKALIIRPTIFSDTDEGEQLQQRGVTHPSDLDLESTTDFRVRTGDYVFRQTGDRYQLRVPNRITLRTGFGHPHQSTHAIGYNHARASYEDPSASVAYDIPPGPEQLREVLSMSGQAPVDFSLFEVIRAPLIPIGDD